MEGVGPGMVAEHVGEVADEMLALARRLAVAADRGAEPGQEQGPHQARHGREIAGHQRLRLCRTAAPRRPPAARTAWCGRAGRRADGTAASRPAPSAGTGCRRARSGSCAPAPLPESRVEEDAERGLGRQRLLEAVDGDGRVQRRVAVHRRRGREHHIALAVVARWRTCRDR